MTAKTIYFGDATLVLAGEDSGVQRFAGAVLAAESRGCHFHAVAATSDGALPATLVAAGCSGRDLVRAMRAMARAIDLQNGSRSEFCDRHADGSAERIRRWLDTWLRSKLRMDRDVTFADLPRPLIIMATDLQRGVPKLWSRRTTPTASVALAVRCACVDSLGGMPAQHDSPDGNALDQRRAFEIEEGHLENCSTLPALLLRFAPQIDDIEGKADGSRPARRLGAIALSRDSDLRFPASVICQEIEIPSATTPRKPASSDVTLRRAARAGYRAASGFFDLESSSAIESGYVSRRLDKAPHAQLLDQIAIAIGAARRSIFISGGDLSWAAELYPLLAKKAIEGVRIRILNTKRIDPEIYEILGRIGCENRRSNGDLVGYGAFIDVADADGSAVLINLPNGKLNGGTLLRASDASVELTALMERLELIWEEAAPQNIATHPQFNLVDWHSVEGALRARVEPYRNARISSELIAVKDLQPLAVRLHSPKIRRAEAVVDLYRRLKLPLFTALRLQGAALFFPPPVIEMVDGQLVVVDGEHRVLCCRRMRIEAIEAIVIRGGGPLPAKVSGWDSTVPLPVASTREQRYNDFNASNWRDLGRLWAAVVHQSWPDAPAAQAARYPSILPQS